MNTTTAITLSVLLSLAITLALVALSIARENDNRMWEFADCIHLAAKNEGVLDPYSQEAWETYAPACVN